MRFRECQERQGGRGNSNWSSHLGYGESSQNPAGYELEYLSARIARADTLRRGKSKRLKELISFQGSGVNDVLQLG